MKGHPSPTWLRKYQEEDEEEAVKMAIKRWRFSFHKYFTTIFYFFFQLLYFTFSYLLHIFYVIVF